MARVHVGQEAVHGLHRVPAAKRVENLERVLCTGEFRVGDRLARDLELLTASYGLSKIAAVDMFPHTPHVEAVALMEKREK